MEMTLEKILQGQGFSTRRQYRDLVLDGDVEIEGRVCEDPSERFLTDGLVFTVSLMQSDSQSGQQVHRRRVYRHIRSQSGPS